MKRPERYVLDSYAILAHLGGEPGGHRVRAILGAAQRGRANIWLSVINLGEVLYITQRCRGQPAVHHAISAVEHLPISVVDAGCKLTFAAAHIKARHSLAYADAFAAALALQQNACLVTGDPEFRQLSEQIRIEWLD